MIDFHAMAPGDALFFELPPDEDGEIQQGIQVMEMNGRPLLIDQEKPIPTPSDVAVNDAVFRNLHRHVCRKPIARDIRNLNRSVFIQCRHDNSHGGVDAVRARSDFPHVRKGHGEADGAVDTHVQRGEIVEKNHSTDAVGFTGFTNDSADHGIMAAWFVAYRAAEPVVIFTQALGLLRHGARSEIRRARDDDSGGLSLCVGIDDSEGNVCHGFPDI